MLDIQKVPLFSLPSAGHMLLFKYVMVFTVLSHLPIVEGGTVLPGTISFVHSAWLEV